MEYVLENTSKEYELMGGKATDLAKIGIESASRGTDSLLSSTDM